MGSSDRTARQVRKDCECQAARLSTEQKPAKYASPTDPGRWQYYADGRTESECDRDPLKLSKVSIPETNYCIRSTNAMVGRAKTNCLQEHPDAYAYGKTDD